MYFFKKAIKHKNTFAKISAAICLVLGAALLLISSGGNVAYPVLAQVMGILLLTFSVYVAIAYLLREYTYSVEPNKHIADDSISEQYDFIITEAKGNRNVKVCHIEISDIRLVRVVDPTNRKQVRGERKNMKRFTYDTNFTASSQIEVVASIDSENYSIIISYDEELLRVFKSFPGIKTI